MQCTSLVYPNVSIASTSGPISTRIVERVRVQFPLPDIYFGMQLATQANSAFQPSGVGE